MKLKSLTLTAIASVCLSVTAAETEWDNVDDNDLSTLTSGINEVKALTTLVGTHQSVLKKIDNRVMQIDGESSMDSTQSFSGTTIVDQLAATESVANSAYSTANLAQSTAEEAQSVAASASNGAQSYASSACTAIPEVRVVTSTSNDRTKGYTYKFRWSNGQCVKYTASTFNYKQ